jgi:hypothetical protein
MHSHKQASAENDAAKPRTGFVGVRQVLFDPKCAADRSRGHDQAANFKRSLPEAARNLLSDPTCTISAGQCDLS